MKQEKLATLSDAELHQQAKDLKPTKQLDAAIIGFMVGIAIYSTIKHGIGLLTFLPPNLPTRSTPKQIQAGHREAATRTER